MYKIICVTCQVSTHRVVDRVTSLVTGNESGQVTVHVNQLLMPVTCVTRHSKPDLSSLAGDTEAAQQGAEWCSAQNHRGGGADTEPAVLEDPSLGNSCGRGL